MSGTRLSPIQMKAISGYLSGKNKKESMLDAGYSYQMADTQAGEFFGRDYIQEEIAKAQRKMQKKSEIDSQWLIDRYRDIIEADPFSALEEKDGEHRLDIKKLDKGMRRSLLLTADGKGRIKINMTDKLRAMESLQKLLGLGSEGVRLEGELSLVERLHAGRTRSRARKTENG